MKTKTIYFYFYYNKNYNKNLTNKTKYNLKKLELKCLYIYIYLKKFLCENKVTLEDSRHRFRFSIGPSSIESRIVIFVEFFLPEFGKHNFRFLQLLLNQFTQSFCYNSLQPTYIWYIYIIYMLCIHHLYSFFQFMRFWLQVRLLYQ